MLKICAKIGKSNLYKSFYFISNNNYYYNKLWKINCNIKLGVNVNISRPFLLWWVQTVAICFASFFIYTFAWFEALYNSDQTKISFLIITVFIIASVTVGYLSYKKYNNFNKMSNYVWFSSETMVTLGLIGTVAGFLLMLSSAFDNLDVKNVENVQEVITDMSLGMSTALCTTLVGLVCSVLTKIQMVILENNQDE